MCGVLRARAHPSISLQIEDIVRSDREEDMGTNDAVAEKTEDTMRPDREADMGHRWSLVGRLCRVVIRCS